MFRAQVETSRLIKPSSGGMFTIGVDVKLVGPLWVPGVFDGIMKRATARTLTYGKDLIAGRTPVDTGNLKSSWYTTDSEIRNDEYYAAFVEYGTVFFDGRFMAYDSVKAIEARYIKNIQGEVGSSVGGAVGSLIGRFR